MTDLRRIVGNHGAVAEIPFAVFNRTGAEIGEANPHHVCRDIAEANPRKISFHFRIGSKDANLTLYRATAAAVAVIQRDHVRVIAGSCVVNGKRTRTIQIRRSLNHPATKIPCPRLHVSILWIGVFDCLNDHIQRRVAVRRRNGEGCTRRTLLHHYIEVEDAGKTRRIGCRELDTVRADNCEGVGISGICVGGIERRKGTCACRVLGYFPQELCGTGADVIARHRKWRETVDKRRAWITIRREGEFRNRRIRDGDVAVQGQIHTRSRRAY